MGEEFEGLERPGEDGVFSPFTIDEGVASVADWKAMAKMVAWQSFVEWLEATVERCRDFLEVCPLEKVEGLRGQIAAYRDILISTKAALDAEEAKAREDAFHE